MWWYRRGILWKGKGKSKQVLSETIINVVSTTTHSHTSSQKQ